MAAAGAMRPQEITDRILVVAVEAGEGDLMSAGVVLSHAPSTIEGQGWARRDVRRSILVAPEAPRHLGYEPAADAGIEHDRILDRSAGVFPLIC